jgi:hypothetical protein
MVNERDTGKIAVAPHFTYEGTTKGKIKTHGIRPGWTQKQGALEHASDTAPRAIVRLLCCNAYQDR